METTKYFEKLEQLQEQLNELKNVKLCENSPYRLIDCNGNTTYNLKNATQIEFGAYVGEHILWDILDKNSDKLLIASHHILNRCKFDNDTNEYKDSKIRKYLNGKFYNNFTDKEKEMIIPTMIDDYDAIDNVFLLSKEELELYYQNEDSRIKTLVDDKDERWWWWLRSPSYSSYVYSVDSNGGESDNKVPNFSFGGVVPALYIKL